MRIPLKGIFLTSTVSKYTVAPTPWKLELSSLTEIVVDAIETISWVPWNPSVIIPAEVNDVLIETNLDPTLNLVWYTDKVLLKCYY